MWRGGLHMKGREKKTFSIFVLVFFLCLFLFETTFYQYEKGNSVAENCVGEEKIANPEAQLSLIEQFQVKTTLNSTVMLVHMQKAANTGIHIVETFFVFVILAAFIISVHRRQQASTQRAYQTNIQNILYVLYRQDGKKDILFMCSC